MPFTLGELADQIGGTVEGDAACVIRRAAALESAGAGCIAFFADVQHREALRSTRAEAVVLRPEDAGHFSGNRILAENPHVGFARIATALHPEAVPAPGVHPSAVVAEDALVAPSAAIGANAVIGARARIGERACVGPNCSVGEEAVIGEQTALHANVTVYARCVIGRRCRVLAGAVIGADGFGYARDEKEWVRMPQVGRVVIGDDVDIGAGTTIDRGTFGDTVLGNRVKLDNQIQIAHNVRVGDDTIMAGCVGIAGSAQIGKRCLIGGRANIAGHLQIADDVSVTATSFVTRSLRRPGVYSSCVPVQDNRQWRRNAARLHRLDALATRLSRLEQKVTGGDKGDNAVD